MFRQALSFGRKIVDNTIDACMEVGRKVRNFVTSPVAHAVGGGGAAAAVAGNSFAQYTPPDMSTLETVINPTTLAAGALALGGVALGAAFTTGGGFRIAKKAYSWIMNKI